MYRVFVFFISDHLGSWLIYDSWRKLRKAAYDGLNKTASEAYRPIHVREAVLLAEALQQDSSDWMNHINR